MAVTRCYICEQNPEQARRVGTTGLEEGLYCPVCHRPTCRHHLVIVRWRWRTPTREVGTALICRECKRVYKHRNWDTVNREWIS